jgi:hypothetical protein
VVVSTDWPYMALDWPLAWIILQCLVAELARRAPREVPLAGLVGHHYVDVVGLVAARNQILIRPLGAVAVFEQPCRWAKRPRISVRNKHAIDAEVVTACPHQTANVPRFLEDPGPIGGDIDESHFGDAGREGRLLRVALDLESNEPELLARALMAVRGRCDYPEAPPAPGAPAAS